MSGELRKGSVAVSEHGDIVLVTRTNVRSDSPDGEGRIHTFHTGTVLRSTTLMVGSRFAGKYLRVVCHIEDILRLAELNPADLDFATPAEIPDSELSEVQLLQRKVAQLEQVVQRPRTGVAALQPRQSET
jgi:hypothetical protein